MAIAFDAATTGTASSASTVSATHTASGSDRAAFMHTSSASATPAAVTATYAGSAMTEHWDATFASFYRHAGYTIVAPATGAQTVTATYAASQGNLRIGVATYTGVDQTTPVGSPAVATGSSTTPSVNITSASGELVVDGMTQVANANATAGANQTERWDLAGAEVSIAGSDEAGATTTTMSWTLPASVSWHIGGIAFKAAAAGPTLVSASDTLAPGVTDTAAIAVVIAASDTLATGITDAVSTLAASLAVSDTLAPAITDAVATLAATLAVSDTIAPGVSDAAAVLAALSASDTLAPGVTDTAAIAVVIAASDTLAPGITDAVSDFAALLAVADTLGTGITDTTAQIFATLAAADALDVRIVDAAALLAALSASDTLATGIADTAAVLVQLSAGDTVAVSISDGALVDILASTLGRMVAIITVRPALAGGVSADAALGAAPRVAPAIGGKPTLH